MTSRPFYEGRSGGDLVRRPDFLCIGAQKAGTTWLHANLLNHVDIYFPPIKEVAYFSSLCFPSMRPDEDAHRRVQADEARTYWEAETVSRPWVAHNFLHILDTLTSRPISDEWYRALFDARQADQIAGEISPQYAILSRSSIAHVLSFNPNIRIIIALRHPVERALSHVRMLAADDPSPARLTQIIGGDWFDLVYWYSDYASWMSRWLGMVPRENVLTVFTSEIRTAPLSVLECCCRFLGVPYAETTFPKANEAVFEGRKLPPESTDLRDDIALRLAPALNDLRRTFPDVADKLLGISPGTS